MGICISGALLQTVDENETSTVVENTSVEASQHFVKQA